MSVKLQLRYNLAAVVLWQVLGCLGITTVGYTPLSSKALKPAI